MDPESEDQATQPQAALAQRARDWLARLPKPMSWGTAGFVAVMAVALGVRLFRLGTVPANLTADEYGFIRLGWHILAGTGPGLFGFDGTPSPVLGTYYIAATEKVFGETIVGGRMCPVLLSMGTLVAFFFLARETLSYLASLLAALLLATNYWFLHFSRTTWTNMNADLFFVAGALMLAFALRKQKWYYYAAAGAFAALSLYGYFSGRLVIFFFLAYLPFALYLYRGQSKQILQGYAILVVTCVVLFSPQIRPVIDNWDSFQRRPDAVLILNQHLPYFGDSNMGRILARQVIWATQGFIRINSGEVMGHGLMGRYLPTGHGLLDPFGRVLFLLGLLAAIWKWRQTALWWVMFLLPVYTIQVFSSMTPDAARGLIVAPFMFLFVGLAIDILLQAGRWAATRIRWTGLGVAAVLSGAVVIFAGADVHLYFDWINSPDELRLRGPDVAVAEFPLWKSLELQAAHAGGADFDFANWCRLQDLSSTTADSATVGLCSNFAPDLKATCLNADDKTPIERDQQRLSDINSLGAALQQYSAKNGTFPSTDGGAQPLCIYPQRDAGCKLQEFLQPMPRDLMAGLVCHGYMYSSDGNTFTLYAALETGAGGGSCPSAPPALAGVQNLYCFGGP